MTRWSLQLLVLAVPLATFAQMDSRGTSPCSGCHSQARSQPGTSMGHALETVQECKILIDNPVLAAKVGKFSYRIERQGDQSNYTVSDGTGSLTLPIRWAMGASFAIGQTYILEKDGQLFESRVSYYRELNGLGPTMGSEGSTPASLNEAAGRLMTSDDKLLCFGCHATNATRGRELTLNNLNPGVQCVHCHTTADTHLAAMLLDSYDLEKPKDLLKLRDFSAERVSNFCGQCHRTWEEIVLQGNLGIGNIRFQPYRLTGSKCYDVDDPRISCLACHDPHVQLSSNSLDYDEKCQACHGGGKPGAKACKVSKGKCVTCHMPKLELPGAHYKFSDHRIRIVKPNEKYPA